MALIQFSCDEELKAEVQRLAQDHDSTIAEIARTATVGMMTGALVPSEEPEDPVVPWRAEQDVRPMTAQERIRR